jgi:hypothetical protein
MKLTLFFKNETVPSGVAMSGLSNGTKKHKSKSHEIIPLILEEKYTISWDTEKQGGGVFFIIYKVWLKLIIPTSVHIEKL